MGIKDYHKCARVIGECVGLKKGIKGYHDCARKSNCKKTDREKVEKVKQRLKVATAKKTISKMVKKPINNKGGYGKGKLFGADYIEEYSQKNMNDNVSKLYTNGLMLNKKATDAFYAKFDKQTAEIDKMIDDNNLSKAEGIKPYLETKKMFRHRFRDARASYQEIFKSKISKTKPKSKGNNQDPSSVIKTGDKYFGYDEIMSGASTTLDGIQSSVLTEGVSVPNELIKYGGSRITKRTKSTITIVKGDDKPFTKKYFVDSKGFEYVKIPFKSFESGHGYLYIYYYDSK